MVGPSSLVTVILVLGDKRKDAMMHDFDLFEPFKRLIDVDEAGNPVCSAYDVEIPSVNPHYAGLLAKFRDVIEQEGSKNLLACFCPGIKEGAWRDPTCTHVSTGHGWGPLNALLTAWGYVE